MISEGKVFVGNEEGLRYKMQTETVEQQLSSLQQRVSTLETDKYRLLDRIDVLEEGSTTMREMRDRFLSTYKRDKLLKQLNDYDLDCISAGNRTAHGGNAKYDATLYSSGRTDYSVYIDLYGLHPAVVSTIRDKATIQVLDQNATDTSSKYKEVTEAYKQTFQDFLRALEENENTPIPFDEPLSKLTQCYWKFCDRVKTDVIDIDPK